MKKILFFSFLTISITQGYTQNFILLANDPSGDVSASYVADVQSVAYSIDAVQDSIWFRVVTYTPMNPNADVGMMFGLDTNQVTTDGLTWNGTNNSMKYDHAYVVFQNSMSPNYYGFLYGLGNVQIPTTVQRPNNYTFIINTRLSLLDTDGSFNLLFGTGAFDILVTASVYDDLPNSGYLTVSPALGTNDNDEEENSLAVYPNPAVNQFTIYPENSGQFTISNIEIHNMLGESVFSEPVTDSRKPVTVDVSNWKAGIYFIAIRNEKNYCVIKKLVKM